MFGEAVGTDEAALVHDLGGGETGFIEQAHGDDGSCLDKKILGADAEGSLEAALQVTKR